MTLIFPIQLNKKEFTERLTYCDGVCQMCGSWAHDRAEPEAIGIFCNECENRSVMGLKRAEKEGLVVVAS